MLIKDQSLINQLNSVVGAQLIRLLVRIFGNDEIEMQTYDSLTVADLMCHIEMFAGNPDIKVKSIEDG